jgi:2-C-methyl-D-erythritol 2,4-cyclodiphosphate synthase
MEKFSIRVGNGYDVHALAAGLPLNICGVKVDSDFGCVAHSDGDVAIHALCDALLGALALGDIGHHFPDSSEEFKGIDSKILLARVMDMVKEKGYLVGNVDITIDLQKPKLASYLPRMRATLSRILGVGENYVSIKATTSEGLGFVGRCEGVQVWATALVFRL